MVHSFACVLGSFIDNDWNIIEWVVDFKVLEDKEHKGLHGGKAFADSACGIGCFNKISASNFGPLSNRADTLPHKHSDHG